MDLEDMLRFTPANVGVNGEDITFAYHAPANRVSLTSNAGWGPEDFFHESQVVPLVIGSPVSGQASNDRLLPQRGLCSRAGSGTGRSSFICLNYGCWRSLGSDSGTLGCRSATGTHQLAVHEVPHHGEEGEEEGGQAHVVPLLAGLLNPHRLTLMSQKKGTFSPLVVPRIPDSVEQRCRQARIRGNCGLFAQTHHAWASADELLHIWDYHKENPKVLVLPADSAIVSVALCPPRPGVFDHQVQWLLVICTRLTVSLVGLHYEPSTGLARPTDRRSSHGGPTFNGKPETTSVTAAGVATSLFDPRPGYTDKADGLTLLQLEGYSARCEGALFHLIRRFDSVGGLMREVLSIRHTSDGHILLASGAPQVYELAYSQSAGWFTSKCRLIRHAGGLQARLRDFLHLSWRCTGRLRLLECASQGYVVAVDDTNSLHLFRIDDWALVPSRAESVAVLQDGWELVTLPSPDLAQMAFQLSKRPLASRIITHLFPVLGLDGHLRLQVVTSASEHLLFVCSASSPNGPSSQGSEWSIVQEFDADWTKAQPNADSTSHAPGTRFHGFWLQQVAESRLGGTTRLLKASESQGSRHSCLEEIREPCVYASGVWVQCAASPGSVAMEVGITARVEDSLEPGNAKSRGPRRMANGHSLGMAEDELGRTHMATLLEQMEKTCRAGRERRPRAGLSGPVFGRGGRGLRDGRSLLPSSQRHSPPSGGPRTSGDPGRSALRGEWAVPGTVIFAADTAESGAVRVTGSGASSGGHWRRLRFNESTEQSAGVLLLDANLHPRHEALAFGYLTLGRRKSLAAVGSATLRCLGTATPWRVLVLGVGLGALPGWFATKAKALVHAIDLDPLVLKAAETVGLMPPALHGTQRCLEDSAQDGPALRTYCCDGVEYVVACAKSAKSSTAPLYDLIVIDVFDGEGETPDAFLTEDFGRSCAAIASSCVVNLTCPVPMWEDAHAFNAPSAGRLADAFRGGFQSQAWSVRVAEGQNLIMAATRMGAPPDAGQQRPM
eukprot:s224_g11.t1